MTTSNSRRQGAVVLTLTQPQPPPAKWSVRLMWWLSRWWEDFTRSDASPRGRSELPVNFDVLLMVDNYRCGMCGGSLKFEEIPSERELARTRFAVGECIKTNCRLFGIRLRVPVQVLKNCEIMK